MPSDADKEIFAHYVKLENALATVAPVDHPAIADAINRLIDAHVRRAVNKLTRKA